MPATSTYSLTGNAYVDGVLGGSKWAVTSLTFSFPTSASFYGAGYGDGEPLNNFAVLNAAQQATARAALDAYSSISNLTFTQVTESAAKHADLRFAMSDAPSTAWAYFPSTAAEGGDNWFNKSSGYYSSPVKGNYAYTTFLHEIGHALGLEHAHEGYVMPVDRDSMEYTVMSYRSYTGASLNGGYTNESWGYAQSLMMYDIAAIQQMYGADYTTNSGDTTYSWSPSTGQMSINGAGQGAPGGNRILLTVWDGGGSDTYDFSNYTTALKVDLRPGEWTTTSATQLAKLHYDGSKVAVGNIANALLHNDDPRSLVENAKGGAGSDVITGNAAANTIWGNSGNDKVHGGAGKDVIFGGSGAADPFDAADWLYGNEGDDFVYGNGGDDEIYGGAGTDTVYGGAGNDVIFGGSGGADPFDAADRLYGKAGDDFIYGNGGNDEIHGGAGTDTIYGGAGNDLISGGAGADSLFGKGGSDSFIFVRGEIHGDTIMDFQGNGDGAGDAIRFEGFGAGGTLTRVGATNQWSVTAGDGSTEIFNFAGNATLHQQDWLFA